MDHLIVLQRKLRKYWNDDQAWIEDIDYMKLAHAYLSGDDI